MIAGTLHGSRVRAQLDWGGRGGAPPWKRRSAEMLQRNRHTPAAHKVPKSSAERSIPVLDDSATPWRIERRTRRAACRHALILTHLFALATFFKNHFVIDPTPSGKDNPSDAFMCRPAWGAGGGNSSTTINPKSPPPHQSSLVNQRGSLQLSNCLHEYPPRKDMR